MVKGLAVLVVVCLAVSGCAVLGDSAITGVREVVSDFREAVNEVPQTDSLASLEQER